MRGAALAVLLLTSGALAVMMMRPHSRGPRSAFADAIAAIDRGNYSAGRNDAMAVVSSHPGSPAAHMLLARAYLLLGDGLAADMELERAIDSGIAPASIAAARARAKLLQGDIDRARNLADEASPGDALAARTLARVSASEGDRYEAERAIAAILQKTPKDAAALTDLGRIRFEAGDIGGASDAAARAAKFGKNDPGALTLQGELVRVRYGLTAALPWFEAALRRDAYFYPALIEYAATLGDVGRHADMLAATRRALAARPGDARSLFLQATLAARAGKPVLARALLQRAGRIDQTIPAAMLLSGGLDYRDARYEQAIGDWRRLVEAQPMNLVARRLYAAALLRSGDAAGALDMLAPMLARGDADTYSLTLAARAAERSGDRLSAGRYLDRAAIGGQQMSGIFGIDGSLAAFAQSAAAAPGDPALQIALIRARLDKGDVAGGVDLARTLAAQNPGDPVMQRALGDTLTAVGRDGEATEAYGRAADLSFDEATMLRLVDALGRTGQARQASAALSLYLQQNPQSLVANRVRAHWLVTNGQGAEAIEALEGVRQAAGDRNSALLTDLTLAYVAAGEGAVARRYGQAAYALTPLDPAVVDSYGLALAADQDIRGARQMFAKATMLDPRNPTIRAHAQQAAR